MPVDVAVEADTLSRMRAAFERARPALAALKEEELLRLDLDLSAAVTTTLGNLPRILALREQVAKELPYFDIVAFDELEVFTLAASYAHALCGRGAKVPQELLELAEQATALRSLLLSDATALSARGLVDAVSLQELRGPAGYRNVALDLLTLANVLRNHWPAVEGNTPASLAELDTAEQLADQLLKRPTLKESAPLDRSAAALTRQRVFTAFASVYDQVRRAAVYLRWDHGDVNELAPPLYLARAPRIGRATDPDIQLDVLDSSASASATERPAPRHSETVELRPAQSSKLAARDTSKA